MFCFLGLDRFEGFSKAADFIEDDRRVWENRSIGWFRHYVRINRNALPTGGGREIGKNMKRRMNAGRISVVPMPKLTSVCRTYHHNSCGKAVLYHGKHKERRAHIVTSIRGPAKSRNTNNLAR